MTFWPYVDDLMQNLQAGIAELTQRARAELESDFSRFAGENVIRVK